MKIMEQLKIFLKKRNPFEKGFTMMEALVALVLISILFILVLNVYTLGVDKSNSISNENKIIGFEQDISSWIKKDYRENSIKEVKVVKEDSSPKLVLLLQDNTEIEYKNKANGFYRVKPGESKRIGDNKVLEIEEKDLKVRMTYRLGNGDKVLSFILTK